MQELNRETDTTPADGVIAGPPPISQEVKSFLDNIFMYHAPKGDQAGRYEALRNQAKFLAYQIASLCPESRERSVAFTKLQECVMFANAAIAINE